MARVWPSCFDVSALPKMASMEAGDLRGQMFELGVAIAWVPKGKTGGGEVANPQKISPNLVSNEKRSPFGESQEMK